MCVSFKVWGAEGRKIGIAASFCTKSLIQFLKSLNPQDKDELVWSHLTFGLCA